MVFGVRLAAQPGAEADLRGLSSVVVALYVLAVVRAWTLLDNPRQGWSAWLNPLEDRLGPDDPRSARAGRPPPSR